jgi:hypothetical protein
MQLNDSFDFLDIIFAHIPARQVCIDYRRRDVVVVASDAQADPGGYPSGGYLAVDLKSGERFGGFCIFDQTCLDVWGFTAKALAAGANPIAPCEEAMPVVFMENEQSRLKDRCVLWFLDNTASLFCFVKGCSGNHAIERSVQYMHFKCFIERADVWYEFVPSKQNWADGASRRGLLDSFARDNGFLMRQAEVPVCVWSSTLPEAWSYACRDGPVYL